MYFVSAVSDAYYGAAAHATTALASFDQASNIKARCTAISPFKKLIEEFLGALFGIFAVAGFFVFIFGLGQFFLGNQKNRGDAAKRAIGGLAALLLFAGGSVYMFGFLTGFGMAPPCI